jgi:hypothetical protein
MKKLTPYEKELNRRIRKLKKQEQLILVSLQSELQRSENIIAELKQLANKYDGDEWIKSEDVHSELMTIVRVMNAY